MIKAIFFDLDGTLLPMEESKFTEYYFGLLCKKVAPYGYEPDSLVKAIWGGVKAMYKNDGSVNNETAFFNFFTSIYGPEAINHKPVFESFYQNEFKAAKVATYPNPLAREIVDFCRKNFKYTILSTNPIFPYVGTKTRMEYIGLKEEDFDYITAYENSSYTKPNPMYFKTLLDKFNLLPEEVILFGNNTLEDYACAKACGIKCIMVGDFVIHNENEDKDIEYIKMTDVISKLKELKE